MSCFVQYNSPNSGGAEYTNAISTYCTTEVQGQAIFKPHRSKCGLEGIWFMHVVRTGMKVKC